MEPSPVELPNPAAELRRRGLAPRRRLGQSFLLSGAVFARLLEAAGVVRGDAVLEVGAGPGYTTRALAARAGRVIAVEIDAGLAAFARETVADLANVTLHETDALGSDGGMLAAPVTRELERAVTDGLALKLVANLPYSAASPLIVTVLESRLGFRGLWVMVQKEVARRLSAEPGSPDYGPLSVFARLWSDVRILETVPPARFWPRPKVDSATVELVRRRERAAAIARYDLFCELVRRLFQGRRKKAANALKTVTDEPRALLAEAGVSLDRRTDRLSLEEIVRLTGALARTAGPPPPARGG
jgi:16S rRNA (adenine1518-N6/adenine1519-N6)-dimethyltransferase